MKAKTDLKARLHHIAFGVALASAVIGTQRSFAAIRDSAPNGFSVREAAHISASPDKVYAALIAPQRWWSPHHTFSGDAANLTLDAKAGGCWCEALPGGGSVLHMTVVYAVPGKVLRLRGAMGPFQADPVDSVMTWTLQPADGGTDIVLDGGYGGYRKDGFGSIAPVVDRVFAEQVARLKSLVETGSAESHQETKP